MRGCERAVQRFSHSVEALALEPRRRSGNPAEPIGKREHARERHRVVRGELRIDAVQGGRETPDTGEIGQVGEPLVSEYRIAREAQLLRSLDLGVPIGALHQPHGDRHAAALAAASGDLQQCIHRLRRARLIGLHRETQPSPAFQLRIRRQRLEQIELKGQAFRSLGVDRKPDTRRGGAAGDLLQAIEQLATNPRMARCVVARVNGGQLHGNFEAFAQTCFARADRPLHGTDRVHSAPKIAIGVLSGARALPQHVEGEAPYRQGARVALSAPQRLGDGLRVDELPSDRIHCETGERQRGRGSPAAQCGNAVCKHCDPGRPVGDTRQGFGEPEKRVARRRSRRKYREGALHVEQRLARTHRPCHQLARKGFGLRSPRRGFAQCGAEGAAVGRRCVECDVAGPRMRRRHVFPRRRASSSARASRACVSR